MKKFPERSKIEYEIEQLRKDAVQKKVEIMQADFTFRRSIKMIPMDAQTKVFADLFMNMYDAINGTAILSLDNDLRLLTMVEDLMVEE